MIKNLREGYKKRFGTELTIPDEAVRYTAMYSSTETVYEELMNLQFEQDVNGSVMLTEKPKEN